jgi:hypothetical protein
MVPFFHIPNFWDVPVYYSSMLKLPQMPPRRAPNNNNNNVIQQLVAAQAQLM